MTPAVRMTGVTKSFGAVCALDGVDLEVRAKSLHAVVGENGAGKTTLMRVLYGAITPDRGEIELSGKVVQLPSSMAAIRQGVGMVSQHYGIIPELSCLENLVLGSEGGRVLQRRTMQARAQELAERMGFQFEWGASASDLSPAAAQKLEILKLLWRDARIMILDEPTAMLSPADGDALFESLRRLADEGATVILVTHRIPEVLNHCESVTVLRGGKLITSLPVSNTNSRDLASLIVGPSLSLASAMAGPLKRETPVSHLGVADQKTAVRLGLSELTVRGHRGEDAVAGASLSLQRGEVVGIAGVDGSGQRELLHAILGLNRVRSGRVTLEGEDVTDLSTWDRIERGVRTIPEDRHSEAVIESWSLELNSTLGLQRLRPYAMSGHVDLSIREHWAGEVADRFHTRYEKVRQPMSGLSGGNQQRFVAGRALASNPQVILGFQPARGLDLLGTAEVYAEIRKRCNDGAAALIVSFDLDELLEHCDRVVVMHRGRILSPADEEARSRDAIGRLMVGAV